MKAPAFWWQPPGLAARLLQPASLVYGAVAGRRMNRPGARAPVPIVCIGNVTIGGAGKTPTALYVGSLLRSMGLHPAFLTRGYGGALAGPILVDPIRHAFRDVGDEALLLARHAPTIVSRDRPAGAALATSSGADAIVMDDGLQNPSLRKDLVIAVFDAGVGVGNGLVLPAGPLRAPLAVQWPRIDAALVIGEGVPGRAVAEEARQQGVPAMRGALRPDPEAAERLRGLRVLAFAGIGRPDKFFATLRELGAEVVEARAFGDHHPYRAEELLAILDAARRGGLVTVTTEKDRARLTSLAAAHPEIGEIAALPVALEVAAPGALQALLAKALRPS